MGRSLFFRNVLQVFQQLSAVGLVVAVHAAVAGGMDARRSVQDVDAQAGIVRDAGLAGQLGHRVRLDIGVFGERLAVLFDLQISQARIGHGDQLLAVFFRDLSEFFQLPLVLGRRDHNILHVVLSVRWFRMV